MLECVCLEHCHSVALSCCAALVEGPSLPFYSMQREGSGYSVRM
jgi:hypothetical protein